MFNPQMEIKSLSMWKESLCRSIGETKVIVHVYPEKHQGAEYDWGFDVDDDDFEDLDPDFLDHKKGK